MTRQSEDVAVKQSALRCMISISLAAISIFGITINPAICAETVWTIDPVESSVTFSVKHLMVSNVNGSFKKVHGTVLYDGKALEQASVEAEIETDSIDTNVHARDEHLRGKSVLNAIQFPSITFKSKRILTHSDGSFSILGTLSMHGANKDIELNAEPLRKIKPDGEGRVHTSTAAVAELNRKDFGITVDKAIDRGGAVVGEKVKINLNIALTAPANTIKGDPPEPQTEKISK